jgi:nucleoid-associated protein YgaU
MFQKGSRYQDSVLFTVSSDGSRVFAGIRFRPIGSASGVIEHRVQTGDRLDLLARHYYNDDRLWWRIVDANPQVLYGGDLVLPEMEGQLILIPRAKEPL